jgi:hypothetical protein
MHHSLIQACLDCGHLDEAGAAELQTRLARVQPRPVTGHRLTIGAALAISVAGCAANHAATAEVGPAGPWAQLALRDVEAARALIRENHPGPVDAQNGDFARWEAEGYVAAVDHARSADSLEGYSAALQRYVGALRDGHLYVTTPASRQPARWPGMVVASRAGRVIVVDASADRAQFPGLPAVGSELVACDGRPAAEILRHDVFPFSRGDERRDASWIRLAPRLFDQENPFRVAPRRCLFRDATGAVETALTWRSIGRDDLGLKWRQAAYGERPPADIRGFGEDGVWATLSTFTPDLMRRALTERERWRSRRVIVLDLRGNTGGSSIWGYQLLATFLGHPPLRPEPRPYDEWRASPGNLEFIETQMVPMAAKVYGSPSRVLRELSRVGAGMRAALARGQALYRHDLDFAGPEAAAEDVAAMAGTLPSPTDARVFLVTDGRCVSACLDFVDQALRYPNVTQVGLATDADSPYTEVRPDIPLPSGLTTLSLAMTVYRNRPRTWKPFVPRHPYPGNIADTPALERWLRGLVTVGR